MANTNVYYKELRFVIEDELTQCYVRLEAYSDAPIGLNGWHHKTFPKSKSVIDIMSTWQEDDPMMWSQAAPKEM